MLRVTLIELLLAATPFILYFAVRGVVRARRDAVGDRFSETPYQLLLVIGAAIAVTALVWQVLDRDAPSNTGKRYVPPRSVDGVMVPGHFVDEEADDDSEPYRYRPTADPLLPPEPPARSPERTRTADDIRGEDAAGVVDESAEDADDALEEDTPS